MMRLRRSSLIVALYVLTSAATASAECAWVMWKEMKRSVDIIVPLKPAGAFTARAQCMSAVKSIVDGDRSVSAAQTPSGWNRAYKDGTAEDYVCLPDTVDPRGPKAK